jgi:hypothetical protein
MVQRKGRQEKRGRKRGKAELSKDTERLILN